MLSVLKASAGSGKTFALTYEYIKMLLGYKDEQGRYHLNRKGSDRHRSILAITFTNKATDEMKLRIVHQLALLAHLEPEYKDESPYLDDLTKLYRCTKEQIHAEATRALQQLLFDFNFFNISTIDSFFQLILRTFAYEAEIEGNYDVDLDSHHAIASATDELFNSLSTNHNSAEAREVAGWITEYLLDRLRNEKTVALFNRSSNDFEEFVRVIDRLSNETFKAHFDEMMEYFRSGKLIKFRKALAQMAETDLTLAVNLAADALTSMHNCPPPKGKFDSNMVKALEKVANSRQLPSSTSKTIPQIASGSKYPFTKDARPCFENGARDAQYSLIIDACQAIVKAGASQTYATNLGRNLFALGLFCNVYTRIEEARANEGILLLSDTNALLRKIIGDDDAPFIFERVGVNLHHFLIDEFQDTSRMQWENLRPLLNESQSNAHDNLIIGDEKQCIYRFRGSEPELLQNQVQTDVNEPVEVLGTPDDVNYEKRNTNWRSSSTMVQANNDIFGAIAQAYNYTDIYANVRQKVAPKNSNRTGYVDIQRISDVDLSEFNKLTMKRMLDHIARQLDNGYKGSEIAVLVRTKKDGATVIAHLLEAFDSDKRFAGRGLHVISDDSLTVDSAPAVRRVIAVLRAIATAQNQTSSTAKSGSTHFHSRAELANLINHYEHQLGSGAAPSEALNKAVASSSEAVLPPIDLKQLRCVNLPSLIERIVAHYFPEGTVPEGQLMYILALEDAVADYCATNNADIQSFLRWWDSTGHSSMVASAADSSAIRVMTIHKAKGLEFPCVHIPLMYAELIKFSDPEWFEPAEIEGVDPDLLPPLIPIVPADWMVDTPFGNQYETLRRKTLLDAINVLYVAFTRAVDELIVGFHVMNPDKEASDKVKTKPSSGQLLNYALQLLGHTSDTTIMGEPTLPKRDKPKERKAVEPVSSISMPTYAVDERNELWESTRIASASEQQFGRNRGNILHNILANVDTLSRLDSAINRAVRIGMLSADKSEEYAELLRRAINASELTAGWFAPEVRTMRERSIVLPDGSVRRPDRIIINPDGTLQVVDYKFGKEDVKTHTEQVADYIKTLQEMGYTVSAGYIWYIATSHTVKIEP